MMSLRNHFEVSTKISLNTCPSCKTERNPKSIVCSKCGFEYPAVPDVEILPKSILIQFTRSNNTKIEGTRLREGDFIILSQQEFTPMTIDSLYGTIKSIEGTDVSVAFRTHPDVLLTTLNPDKEYCIDEAVSNSVIRGQKKHLNLLVRDSVVGNDSNIPRLMKYLLFLKQTKFHPENEAYYNEKELMDFDESQREAIKKAIFLDGLLLIQGPPGTGKSTVISEIVGRLVKKITTEYTYKKKITGNQKINKFNYEYIPPTIPILVTAYTNKAVENLVRKIKQRYPSILMTWYGKPGTTDSEDMGKINLEAAGTKNYCFTDGSSSEIISPDIVKIILERIQVVCATSTMVGSSLLQKCTFHTAIIDEAGQITETSAIIPLIKASNYILVGDHMQLPPISSEESRKSQEIDEAVLEKIGLSKKDSLSTSIFERLSRKLIGTDAFITLKYQYRMNDIICKFSSDQFYDGVIKAGEINKRSVGDQTLADFFKAYNIQNINFDNRSSSAYFFHPDLPFIFINTESIQLYDSTVSSKAKGSPADASSQTESIFNIGEAKVVVSILKFFLHKICEVSRPTEEILEIVSKIGVISGFCF